MSGGAWDTIYRPLAHGLDPSPPLLPLIWYWELWVGEPCVTPAPPSEEVAL